MRQILDARNLNPGAGDPCNSDFCLWIQQIYVGEAVYEKVIITLPLQLSGTQLPQHKSVEYKSDYISSTYRVTYWLMLFLLLH